VRGGHSKSKDQTVKRVMEYVILGLIRFYQVGISPYYQASCRHQPTCSQYTIEAIHSWGLMKGLIMGLRRILRCHPWGAHGYDPVPIKEKERSNNFSMK